jgi:hypothetical protein
MRKGVLITIGLVSMGLLAAVPSTATNSSPVHEVYAYPNPVTQSSAVTFHAGVDEATGLEFAVYDVAGQRVHEVQLSGDPTNLGNSRGYEYRWNFGGLASGAYFLVAKAQKEGGSYAARKATFVVVR